MVQFYNLVSENTGEAMGTVDLAQERTAELTTQTSTVSLGQAMGLYWVHKLTKDTGLQSYSEQITKWVRDTGCQEDDLKNDQEAFHELVEHLGLKRFDVKRLHKALGHSASDTPKHDSPTNSSLLQACQKSDSPSNLADLVKVQRASVGSTDSTNTFDTLSNWASPRSGADPEWSDTLKADDDPNSFTGLNHRMAQARRIALESLSPRQPDVIEQASVGDEKVVEMLNAAREANKKKGWVVDIFSAGQGIFSGVTAALAPTAEETAEGKRKDFITNTALTSPREEAHTKLEGSGWWGSFFGDKDVPQPPPRRRARSCAQEDLVKDKMMWPTECRITCSAPKNLNFSKKICRPSEGEDDALGKTFGEESLVEAQGCAFAPEDASGQ
uniref:Uncharacterized protein n=1 Tax=Noctiluca scintillans TaxID=2966 RepID=A0A7S1FG47_NOCSC|mmetsp:Transcript_58525/g.155778  ORF Transcript_58525/g.155778 Transcript_58525/m.155778 type:complete len:385 (+) Transcript_58525:84-1238(+)